MTQRSHSIYRQDAALFGARACRGALSCIEKLFCLRLIAMAALLLFGLSADADESMPVLALSPAHHVELRSPVEFLETRPGTSLDEVRSLHAGFRPLRDADINRGVGNSVYWLRLRLTNGSDSPYRWVIHHETSYLDKLTIFYRDGDRPFQAHALSDHAPFGSRTLDYIKLGLEHETPAAGYTDLYLRLRNIQPDTATLGFHLWEADRFKAVARAEYLLNGAYFGILLTIAVVSLLCAVALRRPIYLLYATFIACNALLWATLNGFSFQYLWPENPVWHNDGFHIIFLAVPICAFQFSKSYLRTRRLMPRIHRALTVAQLSMVGAIALRAAGLYEPVLWCAYASLGLLALLPLAGAIAWRRGLRDARWYVWAWLVYGGAVVASLVSAATGWLEWGMEPLFYTQLGSLVEVTFLTMGMGERLVRLERERQQAVELALRDPLTGLDNRRGLAQAYNALREGRRLGDGPVFAAVIDMDDFKRINDRYGHDAGDAVLKHFAKLLRSHSRAGDICARYGGEEFAVLLSAPSMTTARQLVDRIREHFAATPTRYGSKTIAHTFSAGVAEVLSADTRLTLREMLRRADAALYAAKTAGRNRTTLYPPDQSNAEPQSPAAADAEGSHTA